VTTSIPFCRDRSGTDSITCDGFQTEVSKIRLMGEDRRAVRYRRGNGPATETEPFFRTLQSQSRLLKLRELPACFFGGLLNALACPQSIFSFSSG
jgi:hypothetical protein